MKYCRNCGTAIPEGSAACPNCGTGVNLAKPQSAPQGAVQQNWQQGAPGQPNRYPQQGAPGPSPNGYPPQGDSSGKKGLLLGCGIALVLAFFLLAAGGIGYYLYRTNSDADTAKTPPAQTSQPPAQEPAGAPSGQKNLEMQQNAAAWNDLVREKDDIDIAIGEVASRANRHLSAYPDFRNAPGLMNDARAVMERARKAESRASMLEGVDPARRNALRSLFAIEVHRAQGLYKGIVDSSNGGDYSYGFGDGTTASYAFDEANAQFNSLYR